MSNLPIRFFRIVITFAKKRFSFELPNISYIQRIAGQQSHVNFKRLVAIEKLNISGFLSPFDRNFDLGWLFLLIFVF